MPDRRAMFVHAHPDDESSSNAATMAKLVDEGAHVTLVTCTLGEEGEVLVPELGHLASAETDALGPHRLSELHAAMDIVGVTDYLRLGGDGRFRDSGMAYAEDGSVIPADQVHDNAFSRADLLEAADELVPVIRDRRPQVLVTYDQRGNYGHPDHIMAHRVATYAAALAAVPSYRPDLGEAWTISRIFWTTMSASMFREGIRMLRAAGDTETFKGLDPDGPMPMGSEDADIAVGIDGHEWARRKIDALHAHASQVDFNDTFWQMFEQMMEAGGAAEYYLFAGGVPMPELPPGTEWADDLFTGL